MQGFVRCGGRVRGGGRGGSEESGFVSLRLDAESVEAGIAQRRGWRGGGEGEDPAVRLRMKSVAHMRGRQALPGPGKYFVLETLISRDHGSEIGHAIIFVALVPRGPDFGRREFEANVREVAGSMGQHGFDVERCIGRHEVHVLAGDGEGQVCGARDGGKDAVPRPVALGHDKDLLPTLVRLCCAGYAQLGNSLE
jgi:hypothetical protein